MSLYVCMSNICTSEVIILSLMCLIILWWLKWQHSIYLFGFLKVSYVVELVINRKLIE